jgi:hypothetical protein
MNFLLRALSRLLRRYYTPTHVLVRQEQGGVKPAYIVVNPPFTRPGQDMPAREGD